MKVFDLIVEHNYLLSNHNFQKMQGYTKLKDQGNELFKEKKFIESINIFQDAIQQIEKNQNRDQLKATSQIGKIYVILHINASLAAINLKKKESYLLAQNLCTKALQIDPQNTKGLYRRGLALKQYAELLQIQNSSNFGELIQLYSKAKKDFEDLNILDRTNELAKQKLSQSIKDIYRVTVAQGKESELLQNTNKSQSKVYKSVEQGKKKEEGQKIIKKTGDMNVILKEYRVQQVTSLAREKVQSQYLANQLPKTRAELEKALREIQKSPEVFLKFIYKMTDEYLKKIQPTFDMLFQIVAAIIKNGQGQQAKKVLQTIRNQKAFELLWKSYVGGEKKAFINKWTTLGLKQEQLK